MRLVLRRNLKGDLIPKYSHRRTPLNHKGLRYERERHTWLCVCVWCWLFVSSSYLIPFMYFECRRSSRLVAKKKTKTKSRYCSFSESYLDQEDSGPSEIQNAETSFFFFATWALQPNSSYGWDCILFIFIYKKKSNKKKFSLNEIQQDSYTIKGTFDNCNISIEIRLSHLALYSLQLLSSFKNERFQFFFLFTFRIFGCWLNLLTITMFCVVV